MLLERARAGFAGPTVAQGVKDAALVRLERWLADPTATETFPVIQALADAGRWELLLDSFYQIIPFGTGGRRGPVGIGPNRINPWTLGTSIQGHCVYLRQRFGEGPLSVVIAYDVRRYLDSRGQSPAGVPNPVLGLSSRESGGGLPELDIAEPDILQCLQLGPYPGDVLHELDRL